MVESGPKKSVFETDMTDRDKTELNQQMLLCPHRRRQVSAAKVLPLQEVLEDQQFYYIVMEKAGVSGFFPSI